MTNKNPYGIMITVCDILDKHEIGNEVYDIDAIREIIDFLDKEKIRYTYASEDLPNMEGYFAVFAWPDEEKPSNNPFLIMFEVKY